MEVGGYSLRLRFPEAELETRIHGKVTYLLGNLAGSGMKKEAGGHTTVFASKVAQLDSFAQSCRKFWGL